MKIRLTLVLGLTVTSLLVAGGVSAAWMASAAGTAQAQAITGEPVTVTEAAATATLYPGVTNGSVVFVVTNPNPYPVQVTEIVAGAPAAITAENASGDPLPSCTAAHGITFNWGTKGGLSDVIVPDGGTFTYTVTGALTMSNGSHADCSGATFTVPVSVTAASAAGSTATTPNAATIAVP